LRLSKTVEKAIKITKNQIFCFRSLITHFFHFCFVIIKKIIEKKLTVSKTKTIHNESFNNNRKIYFMTEQLTHSSLDFKILNQMSFGILKTCDFFQTKLSIQTTSNFIQVLFFAGQLLSVKFICFWHL